MNSIIHALALFLIITSTGVLLIGAAVHVKERIAEERDEKRYLNSFHTLDVCVNCYYDASEGVLPGAHTGCTECARCGHDDCAGSAICDCGWYGAGHGFSSWPCDYCGDTDAGNRYPVAMTGHMIDALL